MNFLAAVLLAGDSGYPLEPWLLTPLSNATTPSEQAYNNAHTKTRSVIERCFGLLKSRFRCLDRSGGTLLYTPEKTCQLITAAAVLHNFCVSRHLPAPVDETVMARDAEIQPPTCVLAENQPQTSTAVDIRRRVIQQFYILSQLSTMKPATVVLKIPQSVMCVAKDTRGCPHLIPSSCGPPRTNK